MTDILLADSGEIDLSGGKMSLVTGADAVGQKLKLKLSSFQGDWFLDLIFGLPYWGVIIRHGVNEGDLAQIYGNAIITTRGVVAVDELQLALPNSQTRSLGVSTKVTTSTGDELNVVTNLSEVI